MSDVGFVLRNAVEQAELWFKSNTKAIHAVAAGFFPHFSCLDAPAKPCSGSAEGVRPSRQTGALIVGGTAFALDNGTDRRSMWGRRRWMNTCTAAATRQDVKRGVARVFIGDASRSGQRVAGFY